MDRNGRLQRGQIASDLRTRHHAGISAPDPPDNPVRRTQCAHQRPPGGQDELGRRSRYRARHPQQCLVGQLGLRPLHRSRNRLCREEDEADRTRRTQHDRRSRWRTGGLHADFSRHERRAEAHRGPPPALRLVENAALAEKTDGCGHARAPDGRPARASEFADGKPARFHDDRAHPPQRDGKLRIRARRDRLDPRR